MSAFCCDGDPEGMKIAVALSGGVDSAVAAALLRKAGYDVLGLTLLLQKTEDGGEPSYIHDAQAVAEALDIPLYGVDRCALFSQKVIEPFLASYIGGETPLPCARCNKAIKFGSLIDEAKARGAQALATGHYVRRVIGTRGAEIHRMEEGARDQSYFLFALTQDQIDFARFPLGALPDKNEVRRLAQEFGLPVFQKPDSQDICFVPDGDYAAFVQKHGAGKIRSGAIVDQNGHVLGQHEGIVHFTVGQRRGLNLSDRVGENNTPLYVLRVNAETQEVVVGPKEALGQRTVTLRELNWLGGDVSEGGVAVLAKLRSTQKARAALFRRLEGGRGVLTFDAPVEGVAPGQAGVLYDGDRLLGGGWIVDDTF